MMLIHINNIMNKLQVSIFDGFDCAFLIKEKTCSMGIYNFVN